MDAINEGIQLEEKGRWGAAVVHYREALRGASEAERPQLRLRLGIALWHDAEVDDAEEELAAALNGAENRGDDDVILDCLVALGRLEQERGNHRSAAARLERARGLLAASGAHDFDVSLSLAASERARGELQKALDLLADLEHRQLSMQQRAEFLDELGYVQLERGDYASAVRVLSEALELDGRVGTTYQAARSQLLLARARMAQGERQKALHLIRDAMEAYADDDRGLSEAYQCMGLWHEDSGEYMAAARWYRQARDLDHLSSDPIGEARSLSLMARTARKVSDKARAHEYLEEAKDLLTGSDDDVERAALYTEEGFLAIDESDFDQAIDRFTLALNIIQDDGDERGVAVAKRKLSIALREEGQLNRAEELLREARPVLEERGDLRELNELLDDLAEVLLERGEYTEAIDHLQRGLTLDEQQGSVASKARTLMLLGSAYLQTGDRPRAGQNLRRALDVYSEAADDVGKSDVLYQLGGWLADEGKLREALGEFRQALVLDSKHGDAAGVARAHRGLAGVYRRLGNLPRAEEHIEDAERELRNVDDRSEALALYIERGRLALDRGNYREARAQLENGLAGFQGIGSRVQAATCQRLLALAIAAEGETSEALDLLERAKAVFEAKNDWPELDELYDDMALVYLQMRRLDEARDCVESSLKLGQQMNWWHGRGRSHVIHGQIAMREGDLEEAKSHFLAAERDYAEAEDEVGHSDTCIHLGDVYIGLGDYDEAISRFKEARRIDQGHGDTRGLARAFRRLGDAYFRKGDLSRAEEAFDQAEDFIKDLNDPRERGPLAFSRGALLASGNQHEEAIRHFQAALNDFKALRHAELVAETYKNLASCYHAIRDFDEALECMREMGLEQAALWGSLIANLQPDVRASVDAAYASGKYGQAVQAAFQSVELRLQELVPGRGNVSDKVKEWVVPERRGLPPFADAQLLSSYQRFVTAGFDVLRNRVVHGGWEPSAVDALAAICVAHLIRIWLEVDAPEGVQA